MMRGCGSTWRMIRNCVPSTFRDGSDEARSSSPSRRPARRRSRFVGSDSSSNGVSAPEWAEWVAAASRFRNRVHALGVAPSEQEALFDQFFSSTVDAENWKARVPTAAEEAEWIAGPGGSSRPEPPPKRRLPRR